MDDASRALLESALVAQVLVLAAQIKQEKAERGTYTTSDCIDDAVRLIARQRRRVLTALSGER